MNIIWKKPDGSVAVSYLSGEVKWLAEEAERLQQSGAVPQDWEAVAVDYPLPAEFGEHSWAWDANKMELVVDLAAAKAAKVVATHTHATTLLASLSAAYPTGEVQSWAQQTREAEALAADPQAPAPLLTAIATARGLSVTELASRVLGKVQAYAMASGQIIGQRQALEDAIAAVDLDAPDAADRLAAIQWPGVSS